VLTLNEILSDNHYLDHQTEISNLLTLYDRLGNSEMTGFLGNENISFSIGSDSLLEYDSLMDDSNLVVYSKGVVVDDEVIIAQEKSVDGEDYYQIYSWDVLKNQYTYILFDTKVAMLDCYDKLKEFRVNFGDEDIAALFKTIGISFDSIKQVLLNQRTEYHPNVIGFAR